MPSKPLDLSYLKRILSLAGNAFALYMFSAATNADACGGCVAAVVDRFFPPVWLWSAFAMGWFLTLSVVITMHKDTILGIPSFGKALLLVLGLVVAGLMVIGPLGVLLLLLSYPLVAWRTFRKNDEPKLNKKLKQALKKVTVTGLACICGLIFYGIFLHSVRTPSEFILNWENTYPGRADLQELIRSGPESLPDLRIIIEKGNILSRAIAAEGISYLGEPDMDMPLLIRAIGKCQDNSSCKSSVGYALKKLSGIDLPETASSQMWQEKWK